MKSIDITGYINADKKEVEIDKHGLDVPNQIITITALIASLYEDAKEEDKEAINKVLHDIADNPKDEILKQFEALKLANLLRGLAHLGIIEEKERRGEN